MRRAALIVLTTLLACCADPREQQSPSCSLPAEDPHVVSLVGGKELTVAVMSDGSVWCWGGDDAAACYGGFRPYPMLAIEDRCVVSVSTGQAALMGIQASGAARFWAPDAWLQSGMDSELLDDTSTTAWHLPTIAQAQAYANSVALLSDAGGLYMVGLVGADVDTGRVFDNIELVETPVRPARLGQGELPCIVGDDGSAYCWTLDEAGTPLNWKGDASSLKRVSLPEPVVDLVAGTAQACALTSAGDVYCVGGYVSPGTSYESPLAVFSDFRLVEGPPPLDSIKMSRWGATACGLDGGELWCWGDSQPDNSYRPNDDHSVAPLLVEPFDDIIDYAVGDTHLCVVRQNSEVWCRGSIDAKGSCSTSSSQWDLVTFEHCNEYE